MWQERFIFAAESKELLTKKRGQRLKFCKMSMKTIYLVSKKPDFSACRLMTESALMSHGYICCGTFRVYDVTGETSTFVGEMNASEVITCITKETASFRVEEVLGTHSECCVPKFGDEPLVLYVSARPLYE